MKSKDFNTDIVECFRDIAFYVADEVSNNLGLKYNDNSACEFHRLKNICNTLDYPDGEIYCYGMGFKYFKSDDKRCRVMVLRLFAIASDVYMFAGNAVMEPEIVTGSVNDLVESVTKSFKDKLSTYGKSRVKASSLEGYVETRGRKKAVSPSNAIDIKYPELLKSTEIDLVDSYVRSNGKIYVKRNYGDFWYLLNRISGNPLKIDIKLWYCDDNHVKCPEISNEPIENKMFIGKVYEHIIKTYSLGKISIDSLDCDKLELSNGASISIDRENNCASIKDIKRYFIFKKDSIHIENDIAKYMDYCYYLKSSDGRGLLKYFKYMFGKFRELDSNTSVKLIACDISKLHKRSVSWTFVANINGIEEVVDVATNSNIIIAKFGNRDAKDAYVAVDDLFNEASVSSGMPSKLGCIVNRLKDSFSDEVSGCRYLKIKKWDGFEYLAVIDLVCGYSIQISSVKSYNYFKIGCLSGNNKIAEYKIKKDYDLDSCMGSIEDKIRNLCYSKSERVG